MIRNFAAALLLVLSQSQALHAAPPEPILPTIPDYARNPRPPKFLFHWTSPDSLRELALRTEFVGVPPMKLLQGSALQGTYKAARGSGLFAWSNPVTGMGMPSELFLADEYARPSANTGEPARLLILRPSRTARVRVVTTGSALNELDLTDNLRTHDLILHLRFNYSGRTLLWQEWIVVNPGAIESFTADSRIGAQFIRSELQKFKDLNFSIPPSERHQFLGEPIPEIMRHRLYEFLERADAVGNKGVPKLFQNRLQILNSSTACQQIFSMQ